MCLASVVPAQQGEEIGLDDLISGILADEINPLGTTQSPAADSSSTSPVAVSFK